ncbi:MAG: hypothetical protein AAFY83_02095, partial [Pseudomonadota bacterium]
EPAPLPTLKVAPTPAPQPVEKPEPATAPQSDPKPLSVPDEPVAIDPSEDPGVPLVLGPVVAPSTASFSTGPSTPTPSLTGEPSISDLLSDEKESDDAVRLSAPATVIAPAGVEEMAPEEDDDAGEKTEDDKDA